MLVISCVPILINSTVILLLSNFDIIIHFSVFIILITTVIILFTVSLIPNILYSSIVQYTLGSYVLFIVRRPSLRRHFVKCNFNISP